MTEVHAAHDSGKVVNPIAIQGQIEGGVLMGMGYALTERFDLEDCVPQVKFGTLPTAPAVQNAYRALTGELQTELPLRHTYYSRD